MIQITNSMMYGVIYAFGFIIEAIKARIKKKRKEEKEEKRNYIYHETYY